MAGIKRKPTKPKPSTEQGTGTENQKSLEQQHKEFRDSSMETVKPNENQTPKIDNQVELEGGTKINLDNEPFAKPTIERDYTDAGINTNKTAQPKVQTSDKGNIPPQKPPVNGTEAPPAGDFEPTPPSGDFEPTPPPSEDPDYVGEHNPEAGDGTSPFNIPSGSANDLVDFGAQGLNYLIGVFGPLLVGVKLHPEFYNFKGMVDDIKEHNEKNTERLKFDSEDIEMIRKPLVAMMQEKGIRGLTNGEQLLVAFLMIGVKKAKVIIEVRKENKIMENKWLDAIRGSAPQNKGSEKRQNPPDEPPLVEAEEV